jgi:hypothetical protein
LYGKFGSLEEKDRVLACLPLRFWVLEVIFKSSPQKIMSRSATEGMLILKGLLRSERADCWLDEMLNGKMEAVGEGQNRGNLRKN